MKSPLLEYQVKKTEFNQYTNLLRRMINSAKKQFYSTQFNKHKNDMKKTWQTLSKALHRNVPKSTPESLLINDQLCTNINVMANTFNKYFATICSEHEHDLSNQHNYKSYLSKTITSTFEFETINNELTLQCLTKLKSSHCCGHDSISNNIIKIIALEISDCLTLIINQSLKTGIFPEKLKTAKVVPIHKKKDKLLVANYRPISILPVISKVFENIMHTQLMTYFNTNNLFAPQQYGFRPNCSTELAALELMDRNINAMNINLTPLNIYLDLSKAFDSLDHHTLLSKLKYYGLHDRALDLLNSYLSGRKQYVQLDNISSDLHRVTCGIPQGSVMGPLLFNIFINDICNATNKFDLVMYADDTTLVSTLENFGNITDRAQLETQINLEINKITNWLISNKLQLNIDKSKYMIFFKSPKKTPSLNIVINNRKIEQIEEFNFLGITIDQNINWKSHTNKISIKISRVIGLLRKLQHVFPQYILKTIYDSLIHPHFLYGLIVWGFQHKRISKLQKRAVRLLAFQPYISHTTPIFKNLSILRLSDLYSLQLFKFHYKNTNNKLPAYFNSFIPDISTHEHNLRSRTIRLPLTKREFFVQSTKYQYIRFLRETDQAILNRSMTHSLPHFIFTIKTSMFTDYDPHCYVNNCYVCQNL